jgi:DNA-binding MarR family transcriptional regulator
MSEAVAVDARGAASPPLAEVAQVADNFVALMRSFARAKARFMAAAEHNVEWSAQIILRHLANDGPMRASSLAECLQSDPSTVSRQVAALVKDGLVERQADPEDGRASILALTAKAGSVIAKHEELRVQHFAGILAGWNERDLRRFADLLGRFTHDFDLSSTNIGPGPVAPRPGLAEGKY